MVSQKRDQENATPIQGSSGGRTEVKEAPKVATERMRRRLREKGRRTTVNVSFFALVSSLSWQNCASCIDGVVILVFLGYFLTLDSALVPTAIESRKNFGPWHEASEANRWLSNSDEIKAMDMLDFVVHYCRSISTGPKRDIGLRSCATTMASITACKSPLAGSYDQCLQYW